METLIILCILAIIWYIIGFVSCMVLYKVEEGKVRAKHMKSIFQGAFFGFIGFLVMIVSIIETYVKKYKIKYTPKWFDKKWLKTNGEKVIWIVLLITFI